jgi:hypothetical protein
VLQDTPALPVSITLSPASPFEPDKLEPASTNTKGGATPQARFSMAEIRARELVPYNQDQYYRCTHRCVLRKGFSLDSPKVGLLEEGDICVVMEARLNEARTTRVKLAEPSSKLASHASIPTSSPGRSTVGGGSRHGGSMYFAPGERWASATMTDSTLSIQPLIEMQCIKRTQLRTGFGMLSTVFFSPLRFASQTRLEAARADRGHVSAVATCRYGLGKGWCAGGGADCGLGVEATEQCRRNTLQAGSPIQWCCVLVRNLTLL